MQPNMQEIPQQMMFQNSQMQMGNPQQISQNQLYQVIQSNSTPHPCEQFSKWLTGSYNIPFTVFLILMGSSLYFIISLVIGSTFLGCFLFYSSFGNLLFALFVWCPMATKIEKNTSTVRYGCLYLINKIIISLFSLNFPFIQTNWNFILFETLLIALSNRNKRMKFFCFKLSGNAVIISSIIYSFVFNYILFYPLIITIAYTFVYKKRLITKFAISNEKVEKCENCCLINWLKNKLSTFVTINDVLEKERQNQPLVQNNNDNNNMSNVSQSSFIPMNMYPNYFSGMAPGMQQMQPLPQEDGLITVNSNDNLNK